MRYQEQVNGKEFFFEADQRLAQVSQFFVGIIRQQEERHAILQEGKLLQIGWNFFKVLGENGRYQILALDYGKDPFADMSADLSPALTFFQRQLDTVATAGVKAVDTTFQHTLLARKSVLEGKNIYFVREYAPKDSDSGWFCASIEDDKSDDPKDYTKLMTYQLLSFCPGAIDIIQFPVGTIAVFEDGQLVEAVDGNNRKLL